LFFFFFFFFFLVIFFFFFFFFFSSRRRHTRLTCDWSSDVCSSDLGSVSRTHSGNNAAAASDAAETYPESHSVAAQMGSEIARESGASARNIPAAVATPFPPLKRT